MVLSRFPGKAFIRILSGTNRFMQTMKNEANSIEYYLKFSEEIVKEEGELASFVKK